MKTVPRNVQIVTQDQAVEAAGLTPALVESAHPRAEVHGLLDGPGHRHLPLLVAGVVVPRRCLVVESPMFVHGLDPSPGAVSPDRLPGGRTETVPGHRHSRRKVAPSAQVEGARVSTESPFGCVLTESTETRTASCMTSSSSSSLVANSAASHAAVAE